MLKAFVIDENKSTVRNDDLINRLRERQLSKAEFRLFAAQRAYIATNFVRLLKKGVKLADLAGATDLSKALQMNLDDELGYDATGQQKAELHHGNWKSDYLQALGIDADIEGFPLLQGTQANVQAFLNLERDGNLFEISGAILSLENIIPLEYRAAVLSRDFLFPEVFCDAENDTAEAIERKRAARIYMDDHIVHDSKSHFPDLLKALLQYESDAQAVESIKRGVRIVNQQRKQFYENVLLSMNYGSDMKKFFTETIDTRSSTIH